MNKSILCILLFVVSLSALAQEGKIVSIKGYAPSYVGQTIAFMEIEDYFSMNEASLASTTVKEDSTFSVSFFIKNTQKIIVKANKNKSYFYIQPNAVYDLYLPEKDKYEAYRPNGNSIEVTFFDLDTTDINFKILQFQRWMDEFISETYYLKNVKPMDFALKIDEFKNNVTAEYQLNDSSSVKKTDPENFFDVFVRYSIASIDNIQFAADRNRYEKHDFYLKYSPVEYKNDAYMDYISTFYEKMIPRLTMETNNRVYLGLLKSSPTLIMKALGSEYTLINMRIREMIMIKALSEEFYSSDFPQTNIITVLDSVAKHSLFEANGIIAKNMINRLTELVQGGKAPDFVLKNDAGEMKMLSTYKTKHLYLHFYDPSSQKSTIELEPMLKMHETYKNDVNFVTIYPQEKYTETQIKTYLETIPWDKCAIESSNPIWKNYKIETYPSYVLIDGFGYVVAAPALGPMPDGQYQTIDKTFYYIQKLNQDPSNTER